MVKDINIKGGRNYGEGERTNEGGAGEAFGELIVLGHGSIQLVIDKEPGVVTDQPAVICHISIFDGLLEQDWTGLQRQSALYRR